MMKCRNLWVFFGYLFIMVVCVFLLISINGNKLVIEQFSPLAKYFSRNYVDNLQDVLAHEAFVEDHIGQEKNKIVLTGSCQLEALWCTQDILKTQCSIASLLEQSLSTKRLPVRVMNLSVGTQVVGHNLHVFLRFLEDPSYKIFIWHNEFGPTPLSNSMFDHTKGDLASHLPYIYNKLGALITKHPNISELIDLYQRIEKNIPDIKNMEVMYLPESKMNILDSIMYNMKYIFSNIIELNKENILQRVRRNTGYLRSIKKRVEASKAQISPKISYGKYVDELNDLDIKPYKSVFYTQQSDVMVSKISELHHDNVISLKIMNKLAALYNKKIYVYIGPEAQCQSNNYFTNNYYKPITDIVSSLTHVELLDLSDMEIVPQRESFNCINMTYLGNKKIANKMSEVLLNIDKRRLSEDNNL